MAVGSLDQVRLVTDGACSGNPGPGGWGAILICRASEREISGGEIDTTNNRMELMAVIRGLEAIRRRCRVEVVTDSRYVMDGITRWMAGWRRNGWLTSARKPVKNQDLWQRLDRAVSAHDVSWRWVKGHSGHAENERVDQLAREAIPR